MASSFDPPNAQAFFVALMDAFYGRMHGLLDDNYDHGRFSYDGTDRSRVFARSQHAAYMGFVAENREGLYATWRMLTDEASRQIFVRLLLYRLLGHLHVRIKDDHTWSSDVALNERVRSWRKGPSILPMRGDFGGVDHFEGVEHGPHRLALDCWAGGVVALVLRRQYYLDRPGVRIMPEPGDVVIDAGAFVGETAVAFAADVGPKGHVYAFDPLPDHLAAIGHNARQNGFQDRVTAVPLALGAERREPAAPAAATVGLDPGFSLYRGGGGELPITTIDHFVAEHGVTRVDFLKMDIEGAELAALRGARQTLVRHRPKLAISLYHRREDFVTIPSFVKDLLPDYEFYLDHYTIHAEETVLYAAPAGRAGGGARA